MDTQAGRPVGGAWRLTNPTRLAARPPVRAGWRGAASPGYNTGKRQATAVGLAMAVDLLHVRVCNVCVTGHVEAQAVCKLTGAINIQSTQSLVANAKYPVSLQIAWIFGEFVNCLCNMKTMKRAREQYANYEESKAVCKLLRDFANCRGILNYRNIAA